MKVIDELRKILAERGQKVSRAKKITNLLETHKGLFKRKQTMTDFKEPVLFFARKNGQLEFYENVTSGKFVYEHSDGGARFLFIRPSDQRTFPYAGRMVRCYVGHEDRPFPDWDEPLVDSESVALGYEKTKATDLKYQERIENLKLKSKNAWVWWLIGGAIAVAIVLFAINTWGGDLFKKEVVVQQAPPISGLIMCWLKQRFK